MKIEGYNYKEIGLSPDYEGQVCATFISSKKNIQTEKAVLYIHGFIDYFFQPHLSDFFIDNGIDFYALELRKYGHSILPHQRPNYTKNVAEYFEEIDAAIAQILECHPKQIFLLGHSTGGLITSLYMNKGKLKDAISGLILNSPFLEMNMPSVLRNALKPISKSIGAIFPNGGLNGMLTSIYPKSVHKDYDGEWDFDLSLKPLEGFKVYFKWFYAIMEAQDWLKKNSNIQTPILLLHSSQSFMPSKMSKEVFVSDIVLNVKHMKSIGPKLGRDVTMREIQDGVHDLILSPQPVREKVFKQIAMWIEKEF